MDLDDMFDYSPVCLNTKDLLIPAMDLLSLVSKGPSEGAMAANNPDYKSMDLRQLNRAALKFWGNASSQDPSACPKQVDVVIWLKEQGLSQRNAEAGATIIRPEWAKKGRPSDK